MKTAFIIALLITLALLAGCAGYKATTHDFQSAADYESLVTRQSGELQSYASLLRVKLKRDDRIYDFRAEIFSRSGNEISLYVRGFLGAAGFKAVVNREYLECYFPREKRFFKGQVDDLESGELNGSRHIVRQLLAFYYADYAITDSARWSTAISRKGRVFNISRTDTVHDLRFDATIAASDKEFPYLSAENIKLESQDRSLMVNVEVSSRSFNREIPDEKFELDIPQSATAMTKEELSDLLTSMGQ